MCRSGKSRLSLRCLDPGGDLELEATYPRHVYSRIHVGRDPTPTNIQGDLGTEPAFCALIFVGGWQSTDPVMTFGHFSLRYALPNKVRRILVARIYVVQDLKQASLARSLTL